MEVRYQRDINSNYLIVEIEEGIHESDYQIPMLINNNIRGLLKLTVGNIDNKMELYYDISSKQKLSTILERQSLTHENLQRILYSIIDTMEVIVEYLLDGKGIVLELEYIYLNLETYQLYFCYNPFYKDNVLMNLHELFLKLIEKVNYEDKEAVELIYKAYQCSQKEGFQIADLVKIIEHESSLDSVKQSYTSVVKPQVLLQQVDIQKEILTYSLQGKILIFLIVIFSFAIGITGSIYIVKTGPVSLILLVKIVMFLLAEIGIAFLAIMKVLKSYKESKIIIEKELLSYDEEQDEEFSGAVQPDLVAETKEDYGDTVLLAYSEKKEKRKLIPIHNLEMSEICITHFPYVIGRIKGQADEIINDPLISRMHLCIEEDNNSYYAVDLNSTNGVSINGVILEANEKRELSIGDELGIANISYVFQ
ncbi:MAG: FHA domain-containing protein [Clostridiales bacterium]|nr:FHA domain-containing protein [Clostridiales bacterium]